MRTFLTLTALLSLSINSFPQNGWIAVNTPFYVSEFQFVNSQTGFIAGYTGKFGKTTDGGISWVLKNIPDTTYWVNALSFINENTGWMTAYKSTGISIDPYFSKIYSTTNSGQSWTIIYTAGMNEYTDDILMLNKDTIIIGNAGGESFVSRGSLTKSFNSGTNYSPFFSGNQNLQFKNIKFINNSTGWVVANHDNDVGAIEAKIFKTTNTGVNWNVIYDDATSSKIVSDVFFTDANTGYVSGPYGKFFATTNGGADWINKSISSTTINITALHFFDANTGFAANSGSSDSSCIYRTTNTGTSWTKMRNSVLTGILKMKFINNLTGWAIGYGAGFNMMKTVTGGLTSVHSIGNSIPDKFFLSQNYPNPFNPVTVISYHLPVVSAVSLKVYDAVGNEVQTLVNEKQNAGSYSVDFNAASLPSGIYFYKLKTDKFSETKKMILVK